MLHPKLDGRVDIIVKPNRHGEGRTQFAQDVAQEDVKAVTAELVQKVSALQKLPLL